MGGNNPTYSEQSLEKKNYALIAVLKLVAQSHLLLSIRSSLLLLQLIQKILMIFFKS